MKWFLWFALLFYVISAQAQIVQFSGSPLVAVYNGPFQGNPNPSISSITPSITCSRSSGQTPAFVQCSASGTTASGTSNPYEDLEYTWNFGDANGTETFANPLSGNTVNANNKQWGPEAAYVYRNAKSYTISLNVRGCTNGPAAGGTCSGGAYTTASATTTFTASSFSASGGTFYYDTSGSGSTCSEVSPCAISEFSSKVANNTQHYFNCGETFSGTTNLLLTNLTGVRIGAGGSACPGSAPIINITSGSNPPFEINANSGTSGDTVVSGITFETSGSGQPSDALVFLTTSGTANIANVYYDNITCDDTVGLGGIECIDTEPNTSSAVSNVGAWHSAIEQPLSGTNCIGVLGGSQQWYFLVGNTASGNGNNNTTKCHDFYIHAQQHMLARWNQGGPTCSGASCSPTRNYTIKDSVDCTNVAGGISGGSDDCVPTYTCPTVCYGLYHVVSENLLEYTIYGRYIGNGNNDPTTTRMEYYVDQQNEFNSLPGGGSTGIFQPITSQTLTVRDERECGSGDIFMTPNGDNNSTAMSLSAYRNLHYDTAGLGFMVWASPTFIGSPMQEVTDNTVESTASSALINNVNSTSGWSIDRNSYYAPSASGDYMKIAGTGVTFSTWQGDGFDTHGSTGTNPNWPNPVSCNFGSWPYN